MKPETTDTIHDTPISQCLYMAIELSHGKWLLGFTIGFGQAPRLRSIVARDLKALAEEIELAGHRIPPGVVVAASPRVSNRIPEDFPEPDSFDPGRYVDPRQEDLQNRWTWIPFGAGRHRCVGNAFAMMQMKAIFSVILRDFEFEMAQPSASYRDDVSKMVIQLQQPCRVRYRRRVR